MASLNKVMLIGNLGRDPELRFTASDQAVVNFTLATHERWTGRDNTRQERVEWHRIVVWGKQGETCAKYLKKGRQVYIEGRIQTRQWEDRDGNNRYTTEIVAQKVVFLGGQGDRPADVGEEASWAGGSGGGNSGGGGGGGPAPSSGGGGGGGRGGGKAAGGGGGGYTETFNDDDIPF